MKFMKDETSSWKSQMEMKKVTAEWDQLHYILECDLRVVIPLSHGGQVLFLVVCVCDTGGESGLSC